MPGAGDVDLLDAADADVMGVCEGECANVEGREKLSREEAVAALDVEASGGD